MRQKNKATVDNLYNVREELLNIQKSLLLDDMTKEEIDCQHLIIDEWVNAIQDNAMEDVPIFIFFCTDRKQMTFIDRMLADRDENSANED